MLRAAPPSRASRTATSFSTAPQARRVAARAAASGARRRADLNRSGFAHRRGHHLPHAPRAWLAPAQRLLFSALLCGLWAVRVVSSLKLTRPPNLLRALCCSGNSPGNYLPGRSLYTRLSAALRTEDYEAAAALRDAIAEERGVAAGKVERGAGAITDWSVSAKVLAASACPSRAAACVSRRGAMTSWALSDLSLHPRASSTLCTHTYSCPSG